jgi:hypothetical protein
MKEYKRSMSKCEIYKTDQSKYLKKCKSNIGKKNEEYNTVKELLKKYNEKMQRCILCYMK